MARFLFLLLVTQVLYVERLTYQYFSAKISPQSDEQDGPLRMFKALIDSVLDAPTNGQEDAGGSSDEFHPSVSNDVSGTAVYHDVKPSKQVNKE